ncbi:MAG: hypothetical protein ACQEP7_02630 [bacterium]
MTDDSNHEVIHDEDNGKFYIPFPDKQAVLRYTHEPEEDEIEFQSIFVPPSLREDGLEEKIVKSAYEFAHENSLQPNPESVEQFFSQNTSNI